MMSTPAPVNRSPRYAGLDGMRAIAVALVVVYHLFPPHLLPGGFIGVDVFFVISGFLITSLLLREHAATGGIRLVEFWRRRARRLLPALALVVTVCATAAWVIGGDVLVRLGAQVLGTATFSYNWVSIAGDTGYFSAATPELFRNFWSLAVEEQFYVLWPLLLPLFLLLPRAWGRVGAAVLLAGASALWMAVVASSGVDSVTRAYFGTDTHAFGILLGVALAFALFGVTNRGADAAAAAARAGAGAGAGAVTDGATSGADAGAVAGVTLSGGWKVVARPAPASVASARVRYATSIVGALAVVGLVVVALIPPTLTAATFPGTIATASLLSGAAITAAVWPGSLFGPKIDTQPMRWIGDRSYGIYLWHWPLLVLAVAATQGTGPEVGFSPWLGLGVLLLTLAAAELSYRFVETPVRRHGFRGSLARLGARFRGTPATRLGAVASVAAVGIVLGGTSAAIAAAPQVTSAEAIIDAGQAALDDAAAEAAAATTPAPAPAETAESAPSPAESAPSPASPPPSPGTNVTSKPVPTPSPTPVTGDMVSAVGDSVMLAAAPSLLARLPGIQVDAAVSRSTWAGPGILRALSSGGALRPYVVLALGTNGPVNIASLEEMVQIAGADRHVILVNAYGPRSWIPGVNADLAGFAEAHPGVVVADWSAAVGARTDLLAGDHIHPSSGGGDLFADVIATAIDGIEQARAQAQYERELRLYEALRDRDRPVPVAR